MSRASRCFGAASACLRGSGLRSACVYSALLLGVLAALYRCCRAWQPPPVEYFAGAEVERMLPLVAAALPEALQGAWWMDQTGAYGHSDLPLGAPDLAISFGEGRWDPSARTLALDVTGPGWTWMNRWDGYLTWWWAWQAGYFYLFELSEDSTVIQVYPSLDLGPAGRWSLPKQLLNGTMVKVTPPPGGACPPRPRSSKKHVVRCATWDRITSDLFLRGELHYYMYQIVDSQGNRVQPYYDAYLQFADSTCRPNRQLARLLGLAHPRGTDCPTAFRGVHGTTSPSIPSSGAPPLPNRTSRRESGEL